VTVERDQDFILDSFRNRDAVENVGTEGRGRAKLSIQNN